MRPCPKPARAQGLTAVDILRALRSYHAAHGDIFLTEVSCGKDRPGGLSPRRMDALAITRNWTPTVTAYEVKVTRSDLLQDAKIGDYLPWCNRLYVAVPAGLATPRDLTKIVGDVGLVEVGEKVILRATVPVIDWRVRDRHRPFPGGQIPWELYHTILLNKARFPR